MEQVVHQGADKKEAIRRAAFALMAEKGFDKMTYSEVAERSGCTRALVQYYYPKKSELLTEFVQRLLEASEEYLVAHRLKTDSPFIDFYITGYMHFHFLLANESLRQLTLDMIGSRSHSALPIKMMADWQTRYAEMAGRSIEDIEAAVLMAVGGAYEYIFHCLQNDAAVDISMLLERAIRVFLVDMGLDAEDFMARHDDYLPTAELIDDANRFLLQRVFG